MRSLSVLSAAILLTAASAFAGTATFSGSVHDTEAQLEGNWWISYWPTPATPPVGEWHTGGLLVYTPDGIDTRWGENYSGLGYTTNLTSLCGGPKTLPNLGTFTIVFDGAMNWTNWWGSWCDIVLCAGPPTDAAPQNGEADNVKIALGLGPPYTWSTYPDRWMYGMIGTAPLNWSYATFGVTPECLAQEDWAPCLMDLFAQAMRISSDGATLTFSYSTDGVTFTQLPGASWPINSLPGGLGNMTSQALSLELNVQCDIAMIKKVEWTAPSVPNVNAPEPVAGCMGDSASTYDAMFTHFTAPFYPTFAAGVFSGPDHNWDDIADPYELALAAKGICANSEIASAYEANLELAKQLLTDDYWGWGFSLGANPQFATQIAAEGLWDEAKGAINWYFWVFDPPSAQLQSVTALTADGDYDGDGFTNKEEYDFVIAQHGSPQDYVYAATGGVAGPGLPVAGLLGLGLMAAGFACAGAVTARRKK